MQMMLYDVIYADKAIIIIYTHCNVPFVLASAKFQYDLPIISVDIPPLRN